ncbi:hypothetical protein BDY19DRAFT_998005 [Irpex rosettiformis]|uniref:Uncharacterized protein n=1 Tax=Irpex rosettiformis TaxID=378272 RepID=A0ACB8TPV4_9APHY|nr:hypothetical protein BDY19DRAFT_998005 [Irpex rosettiformis]
MQKLLTTLVVALIYAPFVVSHSQQEVLTSEVVLDSGDEFLNLTKWETHPSLFVPSDKESTFPFDSTSTGYTSIPQFVKNLYLGDGDYKPWINNTPARLGTDFPWMVTRLGDKDLVPDPTANPPEPVKVTTNPRWRWADCWRPLNAYKIFLTRNAAQATGNGLVIDELIKALPSGDLTTALFPTDVKNLLLANEKAIVNSNKNWVGYPASSRPTQYTPFDGVKVTHAGTTSGAAFKQTNPVGPMSLDATFILATQLAGINWKTVRAQIGSSQLQAGVYWAGAITPEKKDDQLIREKRKAPLTERTMGYVSRPQSPNMAKGSPDTGFYVVLDIDPKIDGYNNPNKNVFVFAAHLIDQHSRVYIKNTASLRNLAYATPYQPGKGSPPQIPSTNKGEDVRFYAHAHAAVMPYTTWMNWIGQDIKPGQKGEPMPNYIQIGEMHLYFLLEDEHDVWPRSAYLKHNDP